MDYMKKFLKVEGVLGQGAFGRVLLTSPIQNQLQVQVQHTPANSIIVDQQSPPRTPDELAEQAQVKEQDETRSATSMTELQQVGKQQIVSKSSNYSITQQGRNVTTTTTTTNRFALKCVHPILKPQRLSNELRLLRDLGGQSNVVQMHSAHFNLGSLFIVMEMIEPDNFLEIVAHLDNGEIKIYMKNLLISLQHLHRRNIMHRDIKPANFLFNRKNKKFLLVDFGLAQTVRTRAPLYGKRNPTTPTTNSTTLSITNPKTPTSSVSKRLIMPKTPNTHDNRKSYHQHVKLNQTPISLNQISTRRFINLTPNGSPVTPNISTKRVLPQALNSTDFSYMLKRLRVSNHEETKEPVKLTVNAYESPVTYNDIDTKRNLTKVHNFSTPTLPPRRYNNSKCDCRGKAKICTVCSNRPESNAPKSGTPGFKAPEILLRYPNQTTAIDIWSAGVMFACLLTGHSPFFRDVDDNTSLADITTLLGSQRMTQAAEAIGIRLIIEPKREPQDLPRFIEFVRLTEGAKSQIELTESAYDLLNRMLDPNPITRITATEALNHPWFSSSSDNSTNMAAFQTSDSEMVAFSEIENVSSAAQNPLPPQTQTRLCRAQLTQSIRTTCA